VPAPLALLLVAVAAFGLMWALFIPPFETPDEQAHFAYTESLVQRHALPGKAGQPEFSSAQRRADQAADATRARDFLAAINPSWSAASFATYRASSRHLSSSDGGGPNAADSNPPLFYLYAAVGYVAGSGGNEFDHLYDMRIWSVPLLLITTLSAWLLAGEVFGRRRLAQLACAAIVGLLPMETFMSSSVNPDALLLALWGLALWLGARVLLRGCRRRDAVALCLVTAAAILTKGTSYALVPAVLLALGLGCRRVPRSKRRALPAELGIPLLALAVPVLVWAFVASSLGRSFVNGIQPGAHPHPFSIGGFLSYLWQFYLPPLPFQHALHETTGLPAIQIWLQGGWGSFGWLSVPLPEVVYRLLAVVTIVIAVPTVGILARRRGRRLELLAFFGLALVGLLGLLHLTDYQSLIKTGLPLLQGRYLLPLLPLFGLAAGLLIQRIPARRRGPLCAAMLAGLILLQAISLATVGKAFYT
jgi:4-amino-4-deoxy-L-arabinose transferase-like glycosyltransferase